MDDFRNSNVPFLLEPHVSGRKVNFPEPNQRSYREIADDMNHSDPSDEGDDMPCEACGGSGLNIEGQDCEECDGLGYWDV